MEIRIGVQHSAREIAFESKEGQDAVLKTVETALTKGGLLQLPDDKGRHFIVPADKIAYVEVGESASRRVGFGAS